MIVDAHVHLGSFPSLAKLDGLICRSEDVVAFRTRHPEFYQASLEEEPLDNSDDLIEVLDKHGIDAAVVQARPGRVPNELVAEAASRHGDRLVALVRIGHEELASGFVTDVDVARRRACEQIDRGIEKLGMRGVGEVFVRAFTTAIHPERIAEDLAPIMERVADRRVPVEFPTAWSQFPGGLHWADPVWVDEVAGRYPEVPIVLTKMGRGVGRYFDAALAVALRNHNVYLDTVGTTAPHLSAAVAALGAQRVMFGTDWSATWRYVVEPNELHVARLRVVEQAGLSTQDTAEVLGGTAARLFGIDTAGRRSAGDQPEDQTRRAAPTTMRGDLG